MIALVWRYQVREAHRAEFEETYGPAGAWAKLFARADGYAGTELLRGEGSAYVTIDRWRAMADFEAFMAAHRGEYEALDRSTEGWTESEDRVGAFEPLGRGC